MRGEASRIADRVSRDSLAPKLRDSGEDAWRIGNELFTITKVLDDSIQLERALTDPSRPVADKVAVSLIHTDDNMSPKDRIIKSSEKDGLYEALDLGAIWLKRALSE